MNDSSKTQTPKGLFSVGSIGLNISKYIANYKGGRNESFMYGIDDDFKWFDYDLVSAYPTAMSLMGDPNYRKGKYLDKKDFELMSDKEIVFSYIMINCSFNFPKEVKYPSIPCFVDEFTTVYPKEGQAHLTGSEYVLAKEQGCMFEISDIYYIPFLSTELNEDDKKKKKKRDDEDTEIDIEYVNEPFYEIVKGLVNQRMKFQKGTMENLI